MGNLYFPDRQSRRIDRQKDRTVGPGVGEVQRSDEEDARRSVQEYGEAEGPEGTQTEENVSIKWCGW